ncbi:DUF3857 domain-containing protein [Pedobacter duraquae]|uniref:Transglutaminase superfamily protein n=1 Tax=Pedobacter duraquae TaxID=425511 RepID=A0A4R6IGK7_9SPHI|nr:DUF3857 domain-containing protein [Pedobacter duraquae]TDO20976.1 transglutaminase superfamily protein [Pedobacter duraquae]
MQILKKFNRSLLLLCVVLFLINASALAQGKNFSISTTLPSWIVPVDPSAPQPKGSDISDGWYISYLERQQHAELKQTYVHVIRHLVSSSGVQNGSEVTVTYDPSFQKLVFHQLRVWRDGKATDRLKEADFKVIQNEKDLSKFIYSGTFDAYAILNDTRKGDRIEYAYSLVGRNPIFGDKFADDFYFESGSSYGKRYTNLIARADRKLDFKSFNHSSDPKITSRGDLKIYSWESTLTNTYKTTEHEPSWYNPFKHTQVSEYHNWAEVVNWGLSVNAYPGLKTPLLNQKANELLKQANNDTKAYMVLAIRFVQDEIRYMGIEMGENSQKPNSPEKVLKQRYGDCKDKALLLCYFLKKVNVPAYMAYVDTYAGNMTRDFLPSPFLFNHVVVMIEYEGEKTWIDATISNQRGGFDNIYFPNYGQALVLKPGNARPEDVISIATGKLVSNQFFELADTSVLHKTKLKIQSTYTDNYADNIRDLITSDGIESVEKDFLDYIKNYYPDAIANGSIKIKDDEAKNQIYIVEQYFVPSIWTKLKKDNGLRYVDFQGDMVSTQLRKVAAKSRIEPFKLKYPVNVEQHIFVKMPFTLTGTTEEEKIENDQYYFEYSNVYHGRELELHYSYRTFKETIDGKDLVQYASDQEKIEGLLGFKISWNGQVISAGNTDTDELFANFQPAKLPISIFLFVLVGSSIFLYKKYFTQLDFDLDELIEAKSIGGWLIVLGLQITLLPISILSKAFRMGAFQKLDVNIPTGLGILANTAQVIFAIGFALAFSLSFLLVFMYYNRRKEFPQYYKVFALGTISLSILEILVQGPLTYAIRQDYDGRAIWSSIFMIIIMGLWGIYFKNSYRVRQTFVFTYPEFAWRQRLVQRANHLITKKFSKIEDVSEPLPSPSKPDQPEETDERE